MPVFSIPSPEAARSNSIDAEPETLKSVVAFRPVAVPTADQVPFAVNEFMVFKTLPFLERQFTRRILEPSEPSMERVFSVMAFRKSKRPA